MNEFQLSDEQAEQLLKQSQADCRALNRTYQRWHDEYGSEVATQMLALLIATVAVSPATGTREPDRWIDAIKGYIDKYWQNFKERKQSSGGTVQ